MNPNKYDEAVQNLNHEKYLLNQLKRRSINIFENNTEIEYFIPSPTTNTNNNNTLQIPQDNEIFYDCSEEDINLNQVESFLERKLSKKSRKSCLSITDSDFNENRNNEDNHKELKDINDLNISSPTISPEKDSIKSLSSNSSNSPSKNSSNRNSWYNNNHNKRLSTPSIKELSIELKRISKNETDPTFLSTTGYTDIEQQAYKELNNNTLHHHPDQQQPFPPTPENNKSNIEPQDSPYANEFQLRRSKNTFKSRKASTSSSASNSHEDQTSSHNAPNGRNLNPIVPKKLDRTIPNIPMAKSKSGDLEMDHFRYNQNYNRMNDQHRYQQQQASKQKQLPQHPIQSNHHYPQQQMHQHRQLPPKQQPQVLQNRSTTNQQSYPQLYTQQQKQKPSSHRNPSPHSQHHLYPRQSHQRQQPSNDRIQQQNPLPSKPSQKRLPSASNTNINDFMIQTPTTNSRTKHRHRVQRNDLDQSNMYFQHQQNQQQRQKQHRSPKNQAPYNFNNSIPPRSQQLHQNLDLLRSEINEFKESLNKSTDDKNDKFMENDYQNFKSQPLNNQQKSKEPSPPKNLSNSDISFDVSYQDLSTDDPLGMDKSVSPPSTENVTESPTLKVDEQKDTFEDKSIKQSTPDSSPKKEFRINVPLNQSLSPEKKITTLPSSTENIEKEFVSHSTPQVSPAKSKKLSSPPPEIASPKREEACESTPLKQSTPEAEAVPIDEVDDIFANIPTVDNDFLDYHDEEDEEDNQEIAYHPENVKILSENDIEISPKFQASPKFDDFELIEDDQFEKSNLSKKLSFHQQHKEPTNPSIKTTSKPTKVNTKLFNKGSVQIIDSNNYEEKMGLKKKKNNNIEPTTTDSSKNLKKKKSFGILSSSSPSIADNIDEKKNLKKKKSWNWLRERSSSLSSMDSNSSLNNHVQPVNNQSKPVRSVSNPESNTHNEESSISSDKENAFSRLFKKKSKINLNHVNKFNDSINSNLSNNGVVLVNEKVPSIKKKSSGLFKKRTKIKLDEALINNNDQQQQQQQDQSARLDDDKENREARKSIETSLNGHASSKLNNQIELTDLEAYNEDIDQPPTDITNLEDDPITAPVEKDENVSNDLSEQGEDQIAFNDMMKRNSLSKHQNRIFLTTRKSQQEDQQEEQQAEEHIITPKEEELNNLESSQEFETIITSEEEEEEEEELNPLEISSDLDQNKETTAELDSKNKLDIQNQLKKQIKRTSKANQPIQFTDSAFGFPLPPPSQSTIIMLDYRFPVHVERAIYRLSHLKLANPKRSLREQVLLSNFMYSYLNLVDHTLQLESE
ncbi:ZDS1 [Candida jiufengensis]|uniref:ZDS1 n=1 Tax=Candida jiufengensis TaxID=497108 RepID=UPI0022251FB6|nr:ZDS1 [Candida jiufengensis]KAI5954960.1 ZDS1 [Candida jiufengensis]